MRDRSPPRASARADERQGAVLLAAANEADRRAEEAAEREYAADERGDVDEAHRAAAACEEHTSGLAVLEHSAGVAYDSADRREAMAEGLDHVQNRAAVDARVRADASQAKPATEATRQQPAATANARKTRGQTGRALQRGVRRR